MTIHVINRYHMGGAGLPDDATQINIMRPSPLGNPFKISSAHSRKFVVARFKLWAEEEIERAKIASKELPDTGISEKDHPFAHAIVTTFFKWEKVGKIYLVCCCAPQACHGDVIKEILERFKINKILTSQPGGNGSDDGDQAQSAGP